MTDALTQMALGAAERYGVLLNVLRSQADAVFRRGPTDQAVREEAINIAQEAARSYLSVEQANINDDTADVARDAHSAALSDLALSDATLEDRHAEFIFASAAYLNRIIAGQAERDIMTMAQHLMNQSMRIDLYVRSGRHSETSAAAQVMHEDDQAPAFQFIDRIGRKGKPSKHIRDIYRQHLLNVRNEIYIDTVVDHGHDTVFVSHPEPNYKWFGQELAIIANDELDIPLYYDVREEIFHPSTSAFVTILDEEFPDAVPA